MKRNLTIEFNMFKGAKPGTFEKANCLRKDLTEAEAVLWNELRNNKLGFKFRRQHPLNHFIADFYCPTKQLVIEVDGDIHNIEDNKEYDENRTFELNKLELKVIRFTNEDVLCNLEKVLDEIKKYL